jgi:hypothetical protein
MQVNVEFSTGETSTTPAEREYIRRRLRHALSENETHITQVQFWIVGILLANGDDAQYALINVKPDNGSLITCDGTDAELKEALSHATQHLCLEVTRNLELRQKTGIEVEPKNWAAL